ncbi:hypothetical protein HPP92_008122 [Vanilla planifolia]|uniref:Uncharacterized protein n=1 Tax=Vanilla planifolia TaxID=51239 RepID=A0A835RHG0_VANPL|nr:hypothetical protein HPP92_008122 [Vanilla planifolia]
MRARLGADTTADARMPSLLEFLFRNLKLIIELGRIWSSFVSISSYFEQVARPFAGQLGGASERIFSAGASRVLFSRWALLRREVARGFLFMPLSSAFSGFHLTSQ